MVRLPGAVALVLASVVAADGGTLSLVSRAADGTPADGPSVLATLSADGRVVAYASEATNLVADDANAQTDVFVHDRATGVTECVSVTPAGRSGDGPSLGAALSADGQVVAFASHATDLVDGDTNGVPDVFVRDRARGTTERVSIGPENVQADGASFGQVSISADGRFVAFRSFAANLAPNDTNGATDVFVHDRETGTTECVSVGVDGPGSGMSFWPSLSADGAVVAFASAADDLVAEDTNREIDVFVRDRTAGSTERISVPHGGRETTNPSIGFPAISRDGTTVVFSSRAREVLPKDEDDNGRVDLLVRTRAGPRAHRVSLASDGTQADGGSIEGVLARDGSLVVFYSVATNLVPGDDNTVADVFAHDWATGETTRLAAGNAATYVSGAAVSADGGVVAVYGEATDLVSGDTNGVSDVFVWEQ